jgi:hypothetical protein
MKHIELICELMASALEREPINKKKALDHAMKSDGIPSRDLKRSILETRQALRATKRMFPQLRETRLRKLSDFYSLTVLIMKYQRDGLILSDRSRNHLAWEILAAFANGVDKVALKQKSLENIQNTEEPYRQYLMTVTGATDDVSRRKSREQILRNLTESIFQSKDKKRIFGSEQRRIIWNTAAKRHCSTKGCRHKLTFDNFTIDHIKPWSRGGKTTLANARLMCRSHNSANGNRN